MDSKLRYGLCIAMSAASFMLSGSDALWAQATKQLKQPAAPKVVTQNNDAKQAPVTLKEDSKEDSLGDPNASQNAPTVQPGEHSQSYSVIIENKIGPDGKRIKTKKVWKNGALVENRQDVVEGTDVDADADASVILSDGETAPGMILRSERSGDESFDPLEALNGTPAEMMQRFEQQFRRQQAEHARRMEAFRQQHGLARGMAIPFSDAGLPAGSAPAAPSQYWIGASIAPVPEILAAQLDLPAGTGVLVVNVVPESPAAKAGIAKYDVLVKVGKTEIKDATAIGKILDHEKGAPQTFEIYRKGKRITLNVTPEKRPDSPDAFLSNDADASGRSQIRVVRPGIIVPADKAATEAVKPAENAKPKNADTPTEKAKTPEAKTTP
ncbi:MAG: PDZ domain-containing protein [Thermoguttaceae bacterium]|nr:PDZ domain-containing protein [Thermoguttaceae bacterium]